MKVRPKNIAPDLRIPGLFIKPVKHTISNRDFGPISRKSAKLKLPGNQYLPRPEKGGGLLRVRVYRSKLNPKGPHQKVTGVLWLHGGGYSEGAPEMARISMPAVLLKTRPCVIAAPDYTLSVEKPYPAAFNDCCQTLLWMNANADELGIRRDQIFIGGESAGGGLAAALSIWARNTGLVPVACQIPIYPMLDDRMQTESMKDNDDIVWSESMNKKAWDLYLGDIDRRKTPVFAAPGRLDNFSGLPPAISFFGSIEPFHDEAQYYMDQLEKSGIPAEYKVFDGCCHAFDIAVPFARETQEAQKFIADRFAYACDHFFMEDGHPVHRSVGCHRSN